MRNVFAVALLCCAATTANAATDPHVDQAIRAMSNAIDGLFRVQAGTIAAVREVEEENKRLRREVEELRIEIQNDRIRRQYR